MKTQNEVKGSNNRKAILKELLEKANPKAC